MNTSEKIRVLRRRKSLTQEQLGDLIGVSYMTVRRWELGKTSPKTEEIKKLAEALNTSVEYLMGLNDSEEKTPQEQNIPININNAPEVSNDDLDLSYWGGVAERASRAARSGDVQKLAAISLMLKLAQEAIEAVNGAAQNSPSLSQTVNVNGVNNKVTDFINTGK